MKNINTIFITNKAKMILHCIVFFIVYRMLGKWSQHQNVHVGT